MLDNILVGRRGLNNKILKEFFITKKAGNFITYIGESSFHPEKQGLDQIACYAHNNIYFTIGASDPKRKWPSAELAQKIKGVAGKYFLGVSCVPELGSLIYWPRDYFSFEGDQLSINTERVANGARDEKLCFKTTLLGAKDLVEAKRRFLEIVKKVVNDQRMFWGGTPLFTVESGAVQKYLYEAGFDLGVLELMPGEPTLMFSAMRGATRGCQKDYWMSHIAIGCYGGRREDVLRQKRWRLSLYLSYISGANVIYQEGGGYKERGKVCNETTGPDGIYAGDKEQYYDPKYEVYLKEIENFYAFVRSDNRPLKGPLVKVGIMHGHLDGWCGMWDRRVWGQFHSPEWEYGPAEKGWDYFYEFFHRVEWSQNTIYGDKNYTGNPSLGQIDIVPVESPLDVLKNYSCLVFLGWNTMTREHYEKLKRYVEEGGHLIMAIAHLSTAAHRNKGIELFNGGDFEDLFGIKVQGPATKHTIGVRFIQDSTLPSYQLPVWTDYTSFSNPVAICGPIPLSRVKVKTAKVLAVGSKGTDPQEDYPVLIENSVGRGKAFLITSWCYPGEDGMREFMKILIQTIVQGEQGEVRFIGSDKIRYAVYEQGSAYRIYLINTDFDLHESGEISFQGNSLFASIPPCGMKVIEARDGSLKEIDITSPAKAGLVQNKKNYSKRRWYE